MQQQINSRRNELGANLSRGALRNQKNQADMEEKLLANRISLLQTEEARLLKKIENTRRKAEQIIAIKKINEERYAKELALEKER